MCYSAQLVQDHREFLRQFPDATISIAEYAKLFEKRWMSQRVSLTKAMEHSFLTSDRPDDAELAEALSRYRDRNEQDLRAELQFQQERLAKATEALAKKATKKAQDDIRIAGNKIKRLETLIADVDRTELVPKDSRIYPENYAPVLIQRDGELVVLPMRYLIRPNWKDEDFDRTNDGCYNVRRDKLDLYWPRLFGHFHGIVMMEVFFENVNRHDYERRPLAPGESPKNAIVEFWPSDRKTMFVPCLYTYWSRPGDDLYGFAVITDEPLREVSETGHDRCVIQIRKERVRDWLDGAGKPHVELFGILDDRPEVTYVNRLDR